MNYLIRKIEKKDNKVIENIIRSCLVEFGGDHEGTAWADPDLGRFSEIYDVHGRCYWVAEDESGKVVGGAGIGELTDDICELQKMYLLKEARGTGVANRLMKIALAFAGQYYGKCYLETLESMRAAQKFYEKSGFHRVYEPVVKTEHYCCDVRYLIDLKTLHTRAI